MSLYLIFGVAMNTKLRKSLERISGYEATLEDQISRSTPEIGDLEVFNFKVQGLIFKCTQIMAPILTVNKIEVSFRFPTQRKQEKSKLYSVINSFNETKVAMKAVLEKVEKDFFQVSFSIEFMCPDGLVVDEMLHPAVKVLRTGGQLLLANLGAHGIAVKDTKND